MLSTIKVLVPDRIVLLPVLYFTVGLGSQNHLHCFAFPKNRLRNRGMDTPHSILKPATLQQHPGLLPAHGIPILSRHSLQPHSNFMHGSTTLMIAIHPTPHINQQDPGQTVQQTAPNRGVCMVPASIVVVMWCSKMKTRNVAGVSYASQNIPSLSFCNFDRCFDSVF